MRHSVSFILPVRDMEYDLRERVHTILEVLAELTDAFDVLIVDYGSRDDTREVALELEREYPQVRMLDRSDCRESIEAIEAGIPATLGEIVFVHDGATPFNTGAVRRLWQIRDDEELVMAQSRVNKAVAALGRPPVDRRGRSALDSSRSRSSDGSSVQMLRRRAIDELRPRVAEKEEAVDRVTRNDLLKPHAEEEVPRLLQRLRRLTSR